VAVDEAPSGFTHSERLAETRRLLDAAAACSDPRERRRALLEVAALNADDVLAVVSAWYRRLDADAADEPMVMAHALDAYMNTILDLEPRPGLDVLTEVLPTLRAAVIGYARDTVGSAAGP
jgi:hypothetical protein